MNLTDQLYALQKLVKRNLKLFLKDKAAVFFSLLAPLIVLLLFLLFLGDIQVDGVIQTFTQAGLPYTEAAVKSFVNSWMFAGVLSVACITVSFGANGVMVEDKQHGLLHDYTASPVKGWAVTAGYFLYNFIVTTVICLLLLLVALVYLAVAGQFAMTAGDVFSLIGVTLFSVLSATLVTVFIASFFKSSNAFAGFSGILSAVIGFVIGAYMPLAMYPKAIQYFVLFVPGSYSAGLFRIFFMQAPLAELTAGAPADLTQGLAEGYSMEMSFFGHPAGVGLLCGMLAIAVALFVVLNIVVPRFKKKK